MKTKHRNNITTSGFSRSQGGIYAPAGYDPLNNKVSVKSGKSQQLKGSGIPSDLFGVVGSVTGGIVGSMSGNPYLVGLSAYAGGATGVGVAKLLGLGMKPNGKKVNKLNGMVGKGLGFPNSAHPLVDFIR